MKKFWIVMNAGERGHRYGQNYFRHESEDSAEREAKRLSAQHRGTFVVMESVSAWQQPTPAADKVELT